MSDSKPQIYTPSDVQMKGHYYRWIMLEDHEERVKGLEAEIARRNHVESVKERYRKELDDYDDEFERMQEQIERLRGEPCVAEISSFEHVPAAFMTSTELRALARKMEEQEAADETT